MVRPLPAVVASLALVGSSAWSARAMADPADAPPDASASSGAEDAPASAELISVELDPSPARPEPLDPLEAEPPPWNPHLELGADVAFVARTVTTGVDGEETGISYDPALGFGLRASWAIIKYLRFTAYFIDSQHDIRYADNALGLSGELSSGSVATFSLGAKVAPTLHFTERLRSWITVGAGWGRLEFGRLQVDDGVDAAGAPRTYEVRERSTPFVEFPLGLGTSFDVWPKWVSIVLEMTAAPVIDQEGNALNTFQTVAYGEKKAVGGYPRMGGHFVQTLGLSLLL